MDGIVPPASPTRQPVGKSSPTRKTARRAVVGYLPESRRRTESLPLIDQLLRDIILAARLSGLGKREIAERADLHHNTLKYMPLAPGRQLAQPWTPAVSTLRALERALPVRAAKRRLRP